MVDPKITAPAADASEVSRVAGEVTAKLAALGVTVTPDDSSEDIVNMLEAVERFESAVQNAGGDLMVDEPPLGSEPQPDNPRFVLPLRGENEAAELYVQRLSRATELVREVPVR